MRFQYLVCLLLAGLAYGQAAQPATPPAAGAKAEQSASAAPEKAPEVKVGPDDTVITLKDFCADATQQGDACKTAITRAQFEKLADALQPGMSPAIRRQLATAYSRVLKMSTAAEKRGLDKKPTFDEMMSLRAHANSLPGTEPARCRKIPARSPTPISKTITRRTKRPTSKPPLRGFLFLGQSKSYIRVAAPKPVPRPGRSLATPMPQPPTEAQKKLPKKR